MRARRATWRSGDRTVIRGFATLNRDRRSRQTVVGSDCLLMAYCHVAHDWNRNQILERHQHAGHVAIEDWADNQRAGGDPPFSSDRRARVRGGRFQNPQDVPPMTVARDPSPSSTDEHGWGSSAEDSPPKPAAAQKGVPHPLPFRPDPVRPLRRGSRPDAPGPKGLTSSFDFIRTANAALRAEARLRNQIGVSGRCSRAPPRAYCPRAEGSRGEGSSIPTSGVPADRKRLASGAFFPGAISTCDGVIVAVPPSAHEEVALERSRAACMSCGEALPRMSRSADRFWSGKDAGVLIQTGHVERFNPALVAARPHIDRPLFVESHRLAPFTPRSLDVAVVLDLMIHDVDLLCALLGEPVTEVAATGVPVLSRHVDIANARIPSRVGRRQPHREPGIGQEGQEAPDLAALGVPVTRSRGGQG